MWLFYRLLLLIHHSIYLNLDNQHCGLNLCDPLPTKNQIGADFYVSYEKFRVMAYRASIHIIPLHTFKTWPGFPIIKTNLISSHLKGASAPSSRRHIPGSCHQPTLHHPFQHPPPLFCQGNYSCWQKKSENQWAFDGFNEARCIISIPTKQKRTLFAKH